MVNLTCGVCSRVHGPTIEDRSLSGLLCRFKTTGDRTAFDEFLGEAQPTLLRIVRSTISRSSCTDKLRSHEYDVWQLLSMRVFEKTRVFDCRREFEPWAYTLARHIVSDYCGRLRNLPLHSLSDIDFDPPAAIVSRQPNLREWIHTHEHLFSDRQLRTLALHLDGLSYADIATALGATVGAVYCLTSRALAKIRDHFNGDFT